MSLVIPTRNRPDALRSAISAIGDGTHLPAQIVIAEQGPVPTPGLSTHPSVELTHLHLDSVGLSRGRNAGIAACDHEIIAFLDDDMLVEPGWLGAIHEALVRAGERGVVTGRIIAVEIEQGHVPSCSPWTESAVFEGRQYADPLQPGCMAIRRSLLDEIGDFDVRLGAGSTYPSAEDNDFGHRLLDAGCRIHLVADAVATHDGARSGRELWALDWAYGRGQGAFYAKHDRPRDRHTRERLRRNARYRIDSVRGVLRGRTHGLHDLVYLVAMVTGYVSWRMRIDRRTAS